VEAGKIFSRYFLSCPDRNIPGMASEYEDKKMKAYVNRRAIMDYGMGILYLGAGVFLMIADKVNPDIDLLPAPYSYVLGGLLVIYGIFRMYRGYKKNYFRPGDEE